MPTDLLCLKYRLNTYNRYHYFSASSTESREKSEFPSGLESRNKKLRRCVDQYITFDTSRSMQVYGKQLAGS